MCSSPYRGQYTTVGLVLLSVLVGACSSFAQQPRAQVPEGVRVKPASEADNATAKSQLQKSLGEDLALPNAFLSDTATVGPTLWAAVKSSADETLLHSKVSTAMLSTPAPIQVVLRSLLTEEQRRSFWSLLRTKYPALKSATVRKANADEIRYYWTTIPFDIEEPFFTVEAGQQTFVVNLRVRAGKPVLFWIDLVGDLTRLGNEDLTADELQEFVAVAQTEIPVSMHQVGKLICSARVFLPTWRRAERGLIVLRRKDSWMPRCCSVQLT